MTPTADRVGGLQLSRADVVQGRKIAAGVMGKNLAQTGQDASWLPNRRTELRRSSAQRANPRNPSTIPVIRPFVFNNIHARQNAIHAQSRQAGEGSLG